MARIQAAAPQRHRKHRNVTKPKATPQIQEIPGLRERKKARLRQQIIETAIRLFRKRGYEKTRVDDIVKILESASRLLPIFPEQRCGSARRGQARLRVRSGAPQIRTFHQG